MTTDPDCVFCRIIRKEIPGEVVHEDDAMIALMDIGPLAEGHLLAIPKPHHANLSDLPPDLIAAVAAHFPRLGRALKAVTRAPAYNILANEGKPAGQEVPHVHFHLIPRTEGDGLGYRWNPKNYEPGRLQSLAQNYRTNLAEDA